MSAGHTLTGLIPTLFAALDTVQRELVGVIPGVSLDSKVERAAKDQTVTSHVAPAATASDITPAVTPPDDGNQTFGTVEVKITKARRVPIRWQGEESKSVNQPGGPGVNPLMRDQFAQAIRTLVNEVETDVTAEARKSASRAYGTAGTAPFGTAADLSDSANVLKIIEANGLGTLERSLILNADAMANVRGKQSTLFKVNEAGSADLLRRGILGDLHGSQARQTAQLGLVTKGTGTGYLVNNGAGYAIGDTAITLDTGTGTILAGDVITFTGDTNKYVVVTALAANVVTIGKPGLRKALADNTALTVGNDFTPSILLARQSLVLAARAPALPEGGDSATDRFTITDPVTGLSFEVSVYKQYRQIQYEVALAWGVKAVKQEGIALLLG
jgi:hypothetical protein